MELQIQALCNINIAEFCYKVKENQDKIAINRNGALPVLPCGGVALQVSPVRAGGYGLVAHKKKKKQAAGPKEAERGKQERGNHGEGGDTKSQAIQCPSLF